MTFSPDFWHNLSRIDQQALTSAVEGGITIAIAASLYYSFFGLILGMSGLVGNVIRGVPSYEARRSFTIICGLIFSSSAIAYMFQNGLSDFYPFDKVVQGSNTHLILSGFLVGFGTQLGSGCTSGHGLCGLPRLSLRSFGAVMIFLITGIITATFDVSKMIPNLSQVEQINLPDNVHALQFLVGASVLPLVFFFVSKDKNKFNKFFRTIIYFFIGAIFGFGLMLAGMSQRAKIYGFLQLNKTWDPSLLFVLMSGVLVNLILFNIMRKGVKKTLFDSESGIISDPRGHIDWKLIIGSFLFGLGWGIGGLCPGPFLLLIPLSSLKVPVFWGVPFFVGMKISEFINPKKQALASKQKTS